MRTLTTQLSGIIRAEVEKQKKRIYMYYKFKNEGKSKKELHLLIKKIKQNNPIKPNVDNIKMELNSICCDFVETEGYFDAFIRLKSITKTKIDIKLPIKYHRQHNKLKNINGSKRLNSFLIDNNSINIRYDFKEPSKKKDGEVVGVDQGIKDVITCSDQQVIPKYCNHNHSQESILKKICRKKKGSKAFKRAKEHQKNFVNWSINKLNLDGIKQINLKKIYNIGYKSKRNRFLSHWQNTLIRDKLKDYCAMQKVSVVEQSSTYRSQCCSACENVRKSNRKGKIYKCKNCGLEIDSDLNASLNHVVNLPDIPH